ncbi:MAG TPA: amidohydrolase family protein [Longimicrobium sp.]|nr:amidohydrolase family protein [Longimicrobium sp.]
MTMRRCLPSLLLCALAACAHAGAAAGDSLAREPALARSRIVPRVDHHQHVMGPTAITVQAQLPPLPAADLPDDLAALLAERGRLSGSDDSTAFRALYTDDAVILDIMDDPWIRWQRGRGAVGAVVAGYRPGTRFVANAYWKDGSAGWVAGTVRRGESDEDRFYFALGLRRDAEGRWRIAVENVTQQPPLPFAQPVTAERIIQVLDDAGIERAVLLSAAYWLGRGSRYPSLEQEHAAVRAENDWVVGQAALHPRRLVAFCGVNPLKEYALAELERCAAMPGVRGMKLHVGNSRIDLRSAAHVEALRRFFRAANERRMAIVIHLWNGPAYGRAEAEVVLNELLPQAPDVAVQIAHLAGGGDANHDALGVFADAIAARDPRTRNLWFDVATSVTEETTAEELAVVAARLRQVGLGRILFGADTPIIGRPPPVQAWATFRRRIPLTDAELRVIAGNVAPYLQ